MKILKPLAIAAMLVATLVPARASEIGFSGPVVACQADFQTAQDVDYELRIARSPAYAYRAIAYRFHCQDFIENGWYPVIELADDPSSPNARIMISTGAYGRVWIITPKAAVHDRPGLDLRF